MTTMDRRRFLQLGLGAGGAVLLGACTRGDEPEESRRPPPPADVTEPAARPTLRLASPEVGFPSPYAYGPGTHALVLLVYDTLLVGDATDGFDPWLAESWERSADGRSYAFALREGARWHDGAPVTAEDVAFSFDYFARHAGELPPTVLFRPDVGTSVRVTGERSGEIVLDEPWVAFDGEVAARFPIAPAHVWADIAAPVDVDDPALLVGSGPYQLREFDPVRGGYRFEAFDEFWMGAPFVAGVLMRQVDNALTALRAGEIDAGEPSTGTPTREVVAVFDDDPAFGVVEGDPDFFAALAWNAAHSGPAGDVAFRRACVHAIDRADLLARVIGEGEPGNPGFLPPGHPAYHGDVAAYPYDPERAAALLEEAGYTRDGDGTRLTLDGDPLVITLLTFPELAPAAELVRDALGRVGIGVEFDPTDFFSAIAGGKLNDYEMALQFFGGLERDADLLREIFASSTEGEGIFHSLGWRNEEFDRLAEEQRATFDEEARASMLARMQELIAAELPLLPLYYATPYTMFRREVFDQWSMQTEDRQILVTGKADGQPPIRPIADS